MWGQYPSFGATGQIILEVPKGNETNRICQCDVIVFLNAVHNNTIKQYLEITAISPHSLSGPIMLIIIVKYFNFQITAVHCESSYLKTFA